jgi:predicted ATPase
MFANLSIPKFGRLNLLVGRNNTGKSSILEAVSLLATNASSRTLREILSRREENLDRTLSGSSSPVFCLFRRGSPLNERFELRDRDRFIEARVALFRWTGEEDSPERRLEPLKEGDDPEGAEMRLELMSQKGRRSVRLDDRIFRSTILDRSSDPAEVRCVFVATGGLTRDELASHWSGIAATALEDRINRQMHDCFPEIERISVVVVGREPATIAKVRGSDRSVALKSLGEGANRFFGLAMAAASASNGVLLIDEVEIGIHYSIQLELWRLLAQTAIEFNVQIFATTHSDDAVRAFGITANEKVEVDGQVIRLQGRDGTVEAVDFDEDELAHAREAGMEVR